MGCGIIDNGFTNWTLEVDREGHLNYLIKFQVETDDPDDGPTEVLMTPGLPQPGDYWTFGNDVNVWATCKLPTTISPRKSNEPGRLWDVEKLFSTRPDIASCRGYQNDDPLLKPPDISGSFVRYMKEGIYDRFGRPITTSSHEQIRGPQNEWPDSNLQVRIEQNVPILNLPLLDAMKDTLNAFPLWGMARRTIKMFPASWKINYYGSCLHYYTRVLEFDIDYKTHDRDVLDEGTKVLKGRWDENNRWVNVPIDSEGTMPDRFNPTHFIRFKDVHDENTRVILDGFGNPYDPNPPESTTECTGCPQGMPIILTVKGFDPNDPQRTQAIGYTGGCTWSTVSTGTGPTASSDLIILHLITNLADELVWSLSVNNGDDGIWQMDDFLWDCMGPNSMLLGLGTPGTPPVIQVLPGESLPGSIHVEYHGESDFLILGIPLTIGT